ncbi:sigma 54-interacting transcriptional regulator [Myxococcota bacterium]
MVDLDRETLRDLGVVTNNARAQAVPRNIMCKIISGDDAGRHVTLGPQPMSIGADRDCSLPITDPMVSRHHAEAQIVPQGVCVRDLSSTNGTFVNAARITEVVVQPGAVVKVGDTSLQIVSSKTPSVPPSKSHQFGGLVGKSHAMRETFAILELAAPTDVTVLLQGESGTGKEVAANALHDHSERRDGPFVTLDCSAIAESLIESQLFGHVRGAFTGAAQGRKGAFLQAAGGTLFLDEIGELPITSQAKILRAIESKTLTPVGSDAPIAVNTRVVAATHRDLSAMVQDGGFRFDLFHRLSVVHIHIPPLRDRPEDIPTLVSWFYRGRQTEPGEIAGANLDALKTHAWPGNVRELRNTLERAWVLAGPGGIAFCDLKLWLQHEAHTPAHVALIDTTLPFKEAKERWNDAFEQQYLALVFAEYKKNITRTAEHCGLTRRHMRNLLRKHGLSGG